MPKKQNGPSVNLGELQTQLALSRRSHLAAEGALKRAQEARDRAKQKFELAEQALRDATRTVLG